MPIAGTTTGKRIVTDVTVVLTVAMATTNRATATEATAATTAKANTPKGRLPAEATGNLSKIKSMS